MIETLQAWFEKPREYVRTWKQETHGKVLGVSGTWVPEEIPAAADILTVRIQDAPSGTVADRYDFLDGILLVRSGAPSDRTLDDRAALPVAYRYVLPLPSDPQAPEAPLFLASQLAAFQKSIEAWTGKRITDAALDRGIEILNESRRLMRQAFETRKKDIPPLSGLEALYLRGTEKWIDKREHSRALKDLLEKELPARDLKLGDRIRLMLLGGADGEPEFVKLVESLGALLVIEDDCLGIRCFWKEVIPAEDRLAAIAARYRDCPPHPAQDGTQQNRMDQVLNLAKNWRVQGAIILRRKCCAPQEPDGPALRQALMGIGIPSLFLEAEVSAPATQFKIRVEAFLETLRPEDLF